MCIRNLTAEEVGELKDAIEDHYYFELVLGTLLSMFSLFAGLLINQSVLANVPCKLCSFVFLDDIRLHGFVGQFSEGHLLPHTHTVFIFTHLQFFIRYNAGKVW